MRNNTFAALSSLILLLVIWSIVILVTGGSLYWDLLGGLGGPIAVISVIAFCVRQIFHPQSSHKKTIMIGVLVAISGSILMAIYFIGLSYILSGI
jgi:hypothetical protein